MNEKSEFNLVLRAYLSIGAVVAVISLILFSIVGAEGDNSQLISHWAITGILAGITLIELSLGRFFGLTVNLLRKQLIRNAYGNLLIAAISISLANIILASLFVTLLFGEGYARSAIVENAALSGLFVWTVFALYMLYVKLDRLGATSSRKLG